MTKNYLLILSGVLLVGALSMQQSTHSTLATYIGTNIHKNSGGVAPGKTGAPGEQNCTACHGGSTLNGATENILTVLNGATPVTSYVPGQTYTVALAMASNPAKKGFQATALDGSDAMAGNFTAGLNTTVNGTAKKYANHTSTSNSSTTALWGWTWTAPSTDVGPVTFYVATNKANNNGQNSGDQIYLSQHVIGSTAGLVEDSKKELNFVAGYNPLNRQLMISFNSLNSGELALNLVDINGRSVFVHQLGTVNEGATKEFVVLPEYIKEGVYFVNCFLGNKPMSARIIVR
jgi:hypothetical protein